MVTGHGKEKAKKAKKLKKAENEKVRSGGGSEGHTPEKGKGKRKGRVKRRRGGRHQPSQYPEVPFFLTSPDNVPHMARFETDHPAPGVGVEAKSIVHCCTQGSTCSDFF